MFSSFMISQLIWPYEPSIAELAFVWLVIGVFRDLVISFTITGYESSVAEITLEILNFQVHGSLVQPGRVRRSI